MGKNYSVFFLLVVFGVAIVTSVNSQSLIVSTKDAIRFVGHDATVCGQVASTNYALRSKGKPTFINIDRPFPSHIFTGVVWGKHRKLFKRPPENYSGYICITGKISTYKGKAQIVVVNPKQITHGGK